MIRKKCDIMFVVNDAGFFISHRLSIAKAAKAAGYEVAVATPPSDEVSRIIESGFTHYEIPLVRGKGNPIKELQTIFRLVKIYRESQPALVHHVTIKPVLYGTLAASLTGVTAVVNAISGLGFVFMERGILAFLRRRVVLASYRWLFQRKGIWVIVQNRDDYTYLLKKHCLSPKQAILIRGSGVNLERFTYKHESKEKTLVILPARMLWDKGVGEFVRAARKLRGKGIEARFALVGGIDASNPKSIDPKQLMRWAIDGDVEWWGGRQHMEHIYAKAHVVCLPSYREGLPKSLLEAAASGRAVVTTDVPGCREAVIEAINGHLVPARDDEYLANALEDLIVNSAKRREMGPRARRMAEEKFSIERVISQHMELYRKALAS